MQDQFMKVKEVMEVLGVSESKAYGVIKTLNIQLSEKGYLTFSGKVSRAYFMEKCCYTRKEETV